MADEKTTHVNSSVNQIDGLAAVTEGKPADKREVNPSAPTSTIPPNGGLVAWTQCFDAFCLWFAGWGLVNSFGVFQAYYQEYKLPRSSPSAVSCIGSLQLCLFIAGTCVVGPLYDLGYLRTLLILGMTLTVFGLMMTSLGSQYWQLILAQGVCAGLGMTCLFVPCVAVIVPWFSSRRAIAMGIATTGSSIGAIIFTITFQQLEPRIGFGWATRVVAFLIMAAMVPPIATMRKRVAHSPARAFIDATAFREPEFVLTMCAMLLIATGIYIPFFYAKIFVLQTDILRPEKMYLAKYFIVLLNTGSITGRLLPNLLADKIGVFNTVIPCSFLVGVLAFTWMSVTSESGLIAFCVFYGFFSGSVLSLSPVVWASLCPNLRIMGTRTSMMTLPLAAGLLVGNPIAGALVGRGSRFVGLQAFCGATALAGAAVLLAARIAKAGWRLNEKV